MAMLSSRLLFSLVSVPLFVAAAVVACGDDAETKTVPTTDGGTSSSGGGSSGTTSSSGTSGTSSSGGNEQDSGEDGCAPTGVAPNLDGGGACGTLPFGQAAAQFQGLLDASDNGQYDGGTLSPGIYDAVIAERASGNPGSWRETFVVGPNNRFTRIRQIDTGGGSGLGEVTYRSGTYEVTGPSIKLSFDCAFDNDAGSDSGSNTTPFEVITPECNTYYRYGAAGIRIWLKRR